MRIIAVLVMLIMAMNVNVMELDAMDELSPLISIDADMGTVFRSIDITITEIRNISNPQIYYTVLESGSPLPGKLDIIFGGRKADIDSTLAITGLKDGYNYDIYLVAVGDGVVSEVVSTTAMAMPFAAHGADTGTFIIGQLEIEEIDRQYLDLSANMRGREFYETARQLDNIQRLADLFTESDGIHGSEKFLSSGYTYILSGDMDLSSYMPNNREAGWPSIGTRIPFSGCFEGNGYTIYGLYIDYDEELYESIPQYVGLFAKTRNAVIRNLVLEEPMVIARNFSGFDDYACIGTLVGESVQSIIESINVYSPRIIAGAADRDGMCAVGGVVGSGINTGFSHITVTGAEISNNGRGIRDVSGGIAGRSYMGGSGDYLLSDISVAGILYSSGKAGGGVIGTLDVMTDTEVRFYAKNIDSQMRVAGTAAFAGGIAANIGYESLLPTKTRITFDNCYASGMIKASESAGGLIGRVNSSVKAVFVAKNSVSEADIIPVGDYAVVGGFVSEVHSGSFENCHSLGSGITSRSGDAGGFVGIVRGQTDFIECLTNRNVQSATNAGGFVGSQDGGTSRFYNCSVGGQISGASTIGDFAGSLIVDKYQVEIVNCTVRGAGASGKLVGNWR